jgi:hypothetical protein
LADFLGAAFFFLEGAAFLLPVFFVATFFLADFLGAAFFFVEGAAFLLPVFFATFFLADFLGAALFFLDGAVFFLADVFWVAFFLTTISHPITSLPVRIDSVAFRIAQMSHRRQKHKVQH